MGSIDCGFLQALRDRHRNEVDLEGLAGLHESMAGLCREIASTNGARPGRSS